MVWAAITEREQLRGWFPCDVVVSGGDSLSGAEISFPFPADVIDMTLSGEVLEVDEPNLLVFTWGEETLRFELSADGDGTLLALIDELPANATERNAAGWDTCLDRLTGLEPLGRASRGRGGRRRLLGRLTSAGFRPCG
ncbi:MAG TPA: SRPBCC domain-containing protein [Solirubrobacteraceae bacterium]|nr:SRPBCC domain-containing protein [Solirubrobacteraceae bacterium]